MAASQTTAEAVILPCRPSIGIYTVATTLLGNDYTFKFEWHERENADKGLWRMSIYDSNNKVIVTGLAIVCGAFIGRRVDDFLFQNGVFIAVDLSGAEADPGFADLGGRCVIQYVPVIELIFRWGGGS